MRRLRRMISCLLPRFRRFGWRAVSRQLSCERGVSCCSWTSLSSTTVSAQSTPPLRRSAQLTQAHPLAHIRLCHCRILHTLTCVTHTSLSQGHIDANRPRCEVADDSRHRIESYYQSLCELHESRGRLPPAGMPGHSHETFAYTLMNSDVMSCLDICLTLVTSARCLLVTSAVT